MSSWSISFQSSHFLMKCSGSSLISDHNKKGWWHLMETYNEPAHVFLVSIAHAKRHSLNVHCQLPSGAKCLNFGLSIYLQPLYVCACSEGSGETVCMRRRVWAFDDQIFNKCQKSHEAAHFFTRQPFSFENSVCSLISVHDFVQSNQGYCNMHKPHMIMKVCMHKVLLYHFRATYPKYCYMIIDRSYMTKKMLIVILSTNQENENQSNK